MGRHGRVRKSLSRRARADWQRISSQQRKKPSGSHLESGYKRGGRRGALYQVKARVRRQREVKGKRSKPRGPCLTGWKVLVDLTGLLPKGRFDRKRTMQVGFNTCVSFLLDDISHDIMSPTNKPHSQPENSKRDVSLTNSSVHLAHTPITLPAIMPDYRSITETRQHISTNQHVEFCHMIPETHR